MPEDSAAAAGWGDSEALLDEALSAQPIPAEIRGQKRAQEQAAAAAGGRGGNKKRSGQAETKEESTAARKPAPANKGNRPQTDSKQLKDEPRNVASRAYHRTYLQMKRAGRKEEDARNAARLAHREARKVATARLGA